MSETALQLDDIDYKHHMTSGDEETTDIDANQSVIYSKDTDESFEETDPKMSATVIDFPLPHRISRLSVLGWLARGLPPQAAQKLRWLLKNLREMSIELYNEVMRDSETFTREELLAWLDIVGDIVPPKGTDIDALIDGLD